MMAANSGEFQRNRFDSPPPVSNKKCDTFLPSIPSKPLVGSNQDVLGKIQNVGSALRRSMGESFKNVQKLKITTQNENFGGKSVQELKEGQKGEELSRGQATETWSEPVKTEEATKSFKSVTSKQSISHIRIASPLNETDSENEEVGDPFIKKLKKVGHAFGTAAKWVKKKKLKALLGEKSPEEREETLEESSEGSRTNQEISDKSSEFEGSSQDSAKSLGDKSGESRKNGYVMGYVMGRVRSGRENFSQL
jgi:hypothetical protein